MRSACLDSTAQGRGGQAVSRATVLRAGEREGSPQRCSRLEGEARANEPLVQYLAGGRVTVTDDPRLSFRVMLHELRVPHGSGTEAVSARRPSSQALPFACAGMVPLVDGPRYHRPV